MSDERFKPYAASYVLLERDERIFMLRRFRTGWSDGFYGLPSGHIEKEEGATFAALRECREEAGIEVLPESLKFAHVMHRIHPGEREYIDFYFVATKWSGGEPHIAETDKADDAQWFAYNALPVNTVACVRAAIDAYRSGVRFSEWGLDE